MDATRPNDVGRPSHPQDSSQAGNSVAVTGATPQVAYGYEDGSSGNTARRESTTSSFAWDFAFHGEFLDTESGYVNYGYRMYVPLLGRWLSRDLIGEEGGNLIRLNK